MITKFKTLVDQCKIDPVFTGVDLKAQYLALGLSTDNGFTIHKIGEALKQQIYDSLVTTLEENGLEFSFFKQFTRMLICDIVLNNTDHFYLTILETIRESATRDAKYRPVESWQQAIFWARARVEVLSKTTPKDTVTLRFQHPRHVDTALAIKQLIQWGYEVDWQGEYITIKEKDRLIDRLEKLIRDIGGLNVIILLFRHLHRYYNQDLHRYLFSSALPGSPDQMVPQVPFNYILNLAAKHTAEQPLISDHADVINAKWREILAISTHLLKILDVQYYTHWEKILRLPENLVQGLYETTILDSATRISQSDPAIEVNMLPVLFGWVDKTEFSKKSGFQLDHYYAVAQAILALTLPYNGPVLLSLGTIQRFLAAKRIPKEVIAHILRLMSHKPEEINVGYRDISESDHCNVHKKMLVRLASGRFGVLDKSWCSMGFYETLADAVRLAFDVGKDKDHQVTNRSIGFALERYIAKAFLEHDITYYSGRFTDINGKEGECDFLVESVDKIILIEVKKKQLSPKARTGDMASLFLDLGFSLLHSQMQAGKAELMLRQQGSITMALANHSKRKIQASLPQSKTIKWNNREILRLSVTHYDFESLHDKIIAKQILQTFVERTINPSPTLPDNILKGYTELYTLAQHWIQQYQKLVSIDPDFADNPFYSSWFLSLGQLLLLLKGVSGNDAFAQSLLKTQSISLSSNNFYIEHLHSATMGEGQTGMAFVTLPKTQ